MYCDYARSATRGVRQGFERFIVFLREGTYHADSVYIDEFMRGMRDEKDAWRLAGLCKSRKLRLTGVDGFSIDGEDWDMRVKMYSLFSYSETKYKRQRVRRGLAGAAEEDRVIGKLPLGYAKRVKRDANGRVIYNSKGLPVHGRAFDPVTKKIVYEMFEKIVHGGWSIYQMTQKFNKEKIDGSDGWTCESIRKLLINPAFIGLFVYNQWVAEWDYEKNRVIRVKKPWYEWSVYFDRDLAIIPKAWHVEMRKRYFKGRARRATQMPSAEERRQARTLFCHTLVCGYCDHKIRLYRSTDKHKDMYCPNSPHKAHGCKLTSSKSVAIIENSLLGYLRDHLITDKTLERLMKSANEYLKQERQRPKVDVQPQRAEARRLQSKIDKLLSRIEAAEDNDILDVYDTRIGQYKRQLQSVQKEIRAAEVVNAEPPADMTLDSAQVAQYVQDLRAVLSEDIPAAAKAIRMLTGRITITQEAIPGRKRGAKWVASFSPNLLSLLAHVGREKNYPDSMLLEYLCRRNWICPVEAQVDIQKVPYFMEIAQEVVKAIDAGVKKSDLAKRFDTSIATIYAAYRYGKHGIAETEYTPDLKQYNPPIEESTPEKIADEVARLRHDEHVMFEEIAERFGVSRYTIERAHVLWHERHPDQPGDIPWRLLCARAGQFTVDQRRQIIRLCQEGLAGSRIAEQLGLPLCPVKNQLQSYRKYCREHDN
ncbi:MAG: hypothetical protein GC162_17520 [Planctomycetes bacterium]|nr:hypothetical protein [Planctomycetota bacterium]